MATIERVEQLRAHANVTYEDAREALDACNDDILEALIYLERNGKVTPPVNGGFFRTNWERKQKPKTPPTAKEDKESIGDLFRRFGNWIAKWTKMSLQNNFVITRNGVVITSLPILIFIILLFSGFPIILLIIGLFFKYGYFFDGPDIRPYYQNQDHRATHNSTKDDVL